MALVLATDFVSSAWEIVRFGLGNRGELERQQKILEMQQRQLEWLKQERERDRKAREQEREQEREERERDRQAGLVRAREQVLQEARRNVGAFGWVLLLLEQHKKFIFSLISVYVFYLTVTRLIDTSIGYSGFLISVAVLVSLHFTLLRIP